MSSICVCHECKNCYLKQLWDTFLLFISEIASNAEELCTFLDVQQSGE